ncbi:MAG: FprA family A-type flavoprotein [Lachnospiraceae bacterium]|nr:FprA family A-type flavoprotein [Lachnospiraceae bacterium]
MYKEVTNTILNVGVSDPCITLFENQYELPEGMAYNSYLIVDDKVCLMDSVDTDVTDEWIANIDAALSDAGKTEIDYLVVQHMEPDHSGSILTLVKKFPKVTIYTSMGAQNMMKQFFDEDLSDRITTIKEGDTLELGSHKLSFIAAPMVHWPEVMMTYEASEKVLFAADGFGKFGVRGAEADDWACEARRYYFNIVGKYGAQVQAVLKKAEGLELEYICSLHGPVLPENEPLDFYIEKYKIWSAYEPEDEGVAICYASIHDQGTKQAALKLAEMLEAKGIKVGVTDLANDDIHEGVEDAFRYDKMILCASSYDADLFPPMTQFLNILKIKAYQKRRVALVENGSWAPSAARVMKSYVEGFKDVTLVEPVVTVRSTLKDADVPKLTELVDALLAQ